MKRIMGAALAAVACTLAGCGDAKEGSVSGTVSLDGKPVSGMTVSFFLPGKGIGASAVLDAAGEFSFTAPLLAGEYVVTLTPPVPLPPEPGRKAPPGPPTPVPKSYGQEGTSRLRADVKPGPNRFALELVAGD